MLCKGKLKAQAVTWEAELRWVPNYSENRKITDFRIFNKIVY